MKPRAGGRSGGGGRERHGPADRRGPAGGGARLAALRAALISQKRGVPADRALAGLLAAGRMPARDRRLAEELTLGSIRHRGSLDLLIRAASSRPPEEMDLAVLEALRQALYQTFFLERIPDHAAVDEAVGLVRSLAGRGATGFVNAVLRAALALRAGRGRGRPAPAEARATLAFRGGQTVRLRRELLPDPAADPDGWLAAHYSYPRWLVAELARLHGRRRAEEVLAWGNAVPPTCVRLNPLRVPVEAAAARAGAELCASGEVFAGCRAAERGEPPGCWRIVPAVPVGELPGLRGGLYTVQDEFHQRAARWLEPRPGERVLDLCAAPGGKATALAELAGDRAEVLACDADAERLELVRQAAARLGLGSVAARHLEAPPLPAELRGAFDAVLADVPCSNTGAMNRRVESRWRAAPEAVAALAARQLGILGAALEAARGGGRVLYSTCSLLAAENEEVVRAALAAAPAARLRREETVLPRAGLHDGGYLALLERD